MLGDKLVKLRKKQGYSQQQVADLLGVSRQTISNWELDQGAPTLDKAAALADAYHVTLDELARDNVEVVSSSRDAACADLHVLQWLVGKTCKLFFNESAWATPVSGVAMDVLAVDADWVRVSYERTRPSTLGQKERVVQLIDVSDIESAVVIGEVRPSVDEASAAGAVEGKGCC